MQKREKILLGATGGAALFFVVNQFLCTSPPQAPKASPVVATASAPEQKTDGGRRGRRAAAQTATPNREPRLLRTGDKPLVRFADWRRDPFQGVINFITTAFDSTVEAEQLKLNGIAWKRGEALALIGNAILREGETAGNIEVLDIREDRVLCRIDGELVTFFLKQDENNFQIP